MPRSSTITVTLPDKLMDAMHRRANATGWGVGAEIKDTVREYLRNPKSPGTEDEMHRQDLQRSLKAVKARKEWRLGDSEDAQPFPTSAIVISFPRELMEALETKKYGRRGGSLAGEVRIALRAMLNWNDD